MIRKLKLKQIWLHIHSTTISQI